MPATEPAHDRVEVPEPPVIDVEDRVHSRLVEFVVDARETVPVNPLTEETVIVELARVPAATGAGEVADTAKLVTANIVFV